MDEIDRKNTELNEFKIHLEKLQKSLFFTFNANVIFLQIYVNKQRKQIFS